MPFPKVVLMWSLTHVCFRQRCYLDGRPGVKLVMLFVRGGSLRDDFAGGFSLVPRKPVGRTSLKPALPSSVGFLLTWERGSCYSKITCFKS